ncbi:MAG: M28 family peptidase [Halobacteriovoraceae bacterium]|jgi:aminopeptidase YwaD|nr:M28 family peptidase [Halobacteriovoraceae bacterium]
MIRFLLVSLVLFSNYSYAQSFEDMIHYLASDKLEGRKAGKIGNVMATNYIAEKLKTYGIEPLSNSYLQEFTIFTDMSKNGANEFLLDGPENLFEPIAYSLSGDIKDSEIAFVGFGITIPLNDPKLKYDDYQNIDVKDKIVIVLTGDPGVGNAKSVFRDKDYINYRSVFFKLKNAISHGAKGIILVNDPLSLENYPNEETPYFNTSEGSGNRFSILAGRATNHFINTKLKNSLTTLKIQQTIAKSQQPMSFMLKSKGSMSVHLKKNTGRISNIVGVIKGTDPKFKDEVVVLGAHMDHLGYGGESSMEPSRVKKIHNGADDNASGTALVLKLAEKLSKKSLKRTHVFVLFNAEEMGLLGATYFVDTWSRYEPTYGKLVGMLNFDMVGRFDKDLGVQGVGTALEWSSVLTSLQPQMSVVHKKQSVGSSDHASFIRKKIPALFFTTGAHEDYHKSSDTAEKINYPQLDKLLVYSQDILKKIDAENKITFDPKYSQDDGQGSSRGYGAHLGCVPEFGQSDDIIGVVCVRATAGSPALNAGIQPGDVLVQIGDVDIKNIYDLAFALKYYRAGDKIQIAWKRGETLFTHMLTLARSTRN